jgi:hypothetical protein
LPGKIDDHITGDPPVDKSNETKNADGDQGADGGKKKKKDKKKKKKNVAAPEVETDQGTGHAEELAEEGFDPSAVTFTSTPAPGSQTGGLTEQPQNDDGFQMLTLAQQSAYEESFPAKRMKTEQPFDLISVLDEKTGEVTTYDPQRRMARSVSKAPTLRSRVEDKHQGSSSSRAPSVQSRASGRPKGSSMGPSTLPIHCARDELGSGKRDHSRHPVSESGRRSTNTGAGIPITVSSPVMIDPPANLIPVTSTDVDLSKLAPPPAQS